MICRDADVVVVGAGIVGAFTALRLAQRNRTVILIDKGNIGRESTGRCGGGVRQQYRDSFGNLHLGIRGRPIDMFEKSSTYSAFVDAGRFYPNVFPFICHIPIIRGFAGFTTWTPDGIPVIENEKKGGEVHR